MVYGIDLLGVYYLTDYVSWVAGSGICLWLGILFGIYGVVLMVAVLVIAWLGGCDLVVLVVL